MLVSLGEAARVRGVDERTIRRMLRDGRATGTQIQIASGYAWMIDLPEEDVAAYRAQPTPAKVKGGDKPAAPIRSSDTALLRSILLELAALRGEVAELRQRPSVLAWLRSFVFHDADRDGLARDAMAVCEPGEPGVRRLEGVRVDR